MKKSFITILLAASAATANAQFFVGVNGKIGDGNFANRDWRDGNIQGVWSCVGINAGYEFIKHIPVSVGVEYAALRTTGEFAEFSGGKFVRMPVMAGYCHYLGNIRLFANAGVFASFGKGDKGRYTDGNGSLLVTIAPKINPHLGYLLQGGVGCRIMDKLLLSASFEYNRPFKERIDRDAPVIQTGWPSSRFVGVTLGASWYFSSSPAQRPRPLLVASPSPVSP
jgi:opacity protein-like surface antigen